MSARKIEHILAPTPYKRYRAQAIQDRDEATIELCCSHLPLEEMTVEDQLLFISMIRNILNIPTERCYKYAKP